jgi:hypothetical protein
MVPDVILNLQTYMLGGMFALGFFTFIAGSLVMTTGVYSKDLQSTITQTNRLVQKSIAEDISGLVGNTNLLLSTMNDVARTRTGVGVILMICGSVLMVLPYVLTLVVMRWS